MILYSPALFEMVWIIKAIQRPRYGLVSVFRSLLAISLHLCASLLACFLVPSRSIPSGTLDAARPAGWVCGRSK
jgi:hypothetical protein